MAAYTIAKKNTTISIATTGDTVVTGRRFVRVRNLGANVVSLSDTSAPTGAVTAGNQSSLLPAGASGKADEIILMPQTTYYFTAATGATLCGFDEHPGRRTDW